MYEGVKFSSCPSVRRFRMFVRSSGQILLPVQCISNEWFKESQRSLQAIFTSPYCSTWLDSGRQRSRLLYSRPSRWPRHLHRRSSVNSKQRPQKVKKSVESTDPLDPVAPWPLTPEVHLLVLLKWHAGNLCIAVVKYFLFYTLTVTVCYFSFRITVFMDSSLQRVCRQYFKNYILYAPVMYKCCFSF